MRDKKAPTPARIGKTRAYANDDLQALQDLWVASWTKAMPSIDFETRRVWFRDHVGRALLEGAVLRLALTESNDIAGFVMINPVTHYLDQICVGPAWWGSGIAEVLLDEARILSPERIVLDVNADNPRAIAFYARQGFSSIASGTNPRSGLATLKLEWRADSRLNATNI